MPWKRWQADFYAMSDRVTTPVAANIETIWERRWLRQAVWAAAVLSLLWVLNRGAGRPVIGPVHGWVSKAMLADFDPTAPGREPSGFWRTASLDDMLADARETASRLPWSKPPEEKPANATLVYEQPGAIPGAVPGAIPGAIPGSPDSPGGNAPPSTTPGSGAPGENTPLDVPLTVDRFAHFPLLAAPPQIMREWGWQTPAADTPALLHEGLDLAANVGDTVVAVSEGTVTATGETQVDGAWLELEHGQGLTTYYAQLGLLHVRVGDRVGPGQAIGQVGASREPGVTVAHVHFEVRRDGKAVEPAPFLPQADGTR